MPSIPKCATEIGSSEWKELISTGAEEFGIETTASQISQLTRFAQLLCDWNKKTNLTAITDPEEVALKHFVDSMALLPFLPEEGCLLDIGSGGGFPGLVLAVFRPELRVTSIDAVRKKISFQQQVIRSLGLKRVCALHVRAESLASAAPPSVASRYNIIVSRALGALGRFMDLALPLLSPGGRIVAYKGSTEEGNSDEIESVTAGGLSLSVEVRTYCLPKYGDRRSLVFLKPG